MGIAENDNNGLPQLNNIQTYCDRVIWIHQGRIEEDAGPISVVERYKEMKIRSTQNIQ